MPKQEIETAVVGGERYTIGQRVCIVGRGTANVVHRHGTVARFTPTMMIVEYPFPRLAKEPQIITRRYRTGRGSGREVGTHEYGGSSVAPRCQRPKPKQ